MKALGVKRGFPDLILPVATESAPGLVIEMKSEKGRLSPEQDEWLAHYALQGWITHVCRSAEEARECVCHYFGLSPDDAPALG